jgi:murein DD-endopeptidase MepM/ murein hydrolase activator NlpD
MHNARLGVELSRYEMRNGWCGRSSVHAKDCTIGAARAPMQQLQACRSTLIAGYERRNIVACSFYVTHRRLVVHVVALMLVVCATVGSVTPAAAVTSWQGVKYGQSAPIIRAGDGTQRKAVKALQILLNKYGYRLAVNGVYDRATQRAVLDFKQRRDLGRSTTVGEATWQKLTDRQAASAAPPAQKRTGQQAASGYVLPIRRSIVPRGAYGDPHHDYPAVDLPVSTGTPVYAMRSGSVSNAGGACGRGIIITADDGALYRYCHFSSRAVAPGTGVRTGQYIGATGNTGHSTGPHLHLDIRYGGMQRCPQSMLLAVYDGTSVPDPSTLPTSGCTFKWGQ